MRLVFLTPMVGDDIYVKYQKEQGKFHPGQKFYSLLLAGINENRYKKMIISVYDKSYECYSDLFKNDEEHLYISREKIKDRKKCSDVAEKICKVISPQDILVADGESYWPMVLALKIRHVLGNQIIEIITDYSHHVLRYGRLYQEDNFFIQRLKYIYMFCRLFKVRKANAFILLTKYMDVYLPKKKPYIVIEGFSQHFSYVQYKKNESVCIITYVGTLNLQSGIRNLVDAFREIPRTDVELHIYGDGEAKEYIIGMTKKDQRIRYYGVIPLEDVYMVEQKSHFLINPRPSKGEYNKFSFPSKTLEYLSSGTPLISTRLSGIPDDYDDHINWLNDDSIQSMGEHIERILNTDYKYFLLKAEKARNYVESEKSPKAQTRKIQELLQRIEQDW